MMTVLGILVLTVRFFDVLQLGGQVRSDIGAGFYQRREVGRCLAEEFRKVVCGVHSAGEV